MTTAPSRDLGHGVRRTATNHPSARSCLLSVCIALAAVLIQSLSVSAQSNYTFVETGFGAASHVNDEGTVVGFFGPDGSRGYVWTEAGGAQPMIADPEDSLKFPCYVPRRLVINAEGVIAGQGAAVTCGNSPHRAATWSAQSGVVILGGEDDGAAARGINRHGVVVGLYRGNSQVPFIWRPATGIQVLPTFGLEQGGDAHDINDSEQVVGRHGNTLSAFIWSESAGRLDLPKLPAAPAASYEALAITNSGFVVGRYNGTTNGVFFWSAAAGTVDLNAPAGLPEFIDINEWGDVVATIIVPAGGRVPFLYRGGVWTNLNDLRPIGTSFQLQTVTAINNRGWVVGSGTNLPPAEQGLGYVLIPPTVDVTANGDDGPVMLGPGDPLQIELAFDAHAVATINPAEVYIGVQTPFGLLWLGPGGFAATPTRLYAGPLPTFGPVPLFSLPDASVLPAGTYVWFMIVDEDSDGVVDAHLLDAVVTTRTP